MNQTDHDVQSWEEDPEVLALIDRVDTLSDREVEDLCRRMGVNLEESAARARYLFAALDLDRPSAEIGGTIRAQSDLDTAVRLGTATRH